jgi:hypothetical protein
MDLIKIILNRLEKNSIISDNLNYQHKYASAQFVSLANFILLPISIAGDIVEIIKKKRK